MEWFKFRTCWRRPLLKLTDEEAGRVVKALVTFIDTGEEQEAGFREVSFRANGLCGAIIGWKQRPLAE